MESLLMRQEELLYMQGLTDPIKNKEGVAECLGHFHFYNAQKEHYVLAEIPRNPRIRVRWEWQKIKGLQTLIVGMWSLDVRDKVITKKFQLKVLRVISKVAFLRQLRDMFYNLERDCVRGSVEDI